MKKLLTTISISLLMICMLCMSVFAEDLEVIDNYGGYEAEAFAETAQSFLDQMLAADDETFALYLEQYTEDEGIYNGFELVGKIRELGEEFTGYGPYNLYLNEEDAVRCYQVIHFENSDYVFIVGFDTELSWDYCDVKKITYLSDQDENALLDLSNCKLKNFGGGEGFTFTFDGETLKGALRNAVIGILVVFCMLVFISLIISLFKYIPSEEKRAFEQQQKKAAEADKQKAAEPKKEAPAVVQHTPDLSGDAQLAAVIAAAVAAYEGKSADSFIVRTINTRKWK